MPDLDRLADAHLSNQAEDIGGLADRHRDDGMVERCAGKQAGQMVELNVTVDRQVEWHGVEHRIAIQARTQSFEEELE